MKNKIFKKLVFVPAFIIIACAVLIIARTSWVYDQRMKVLSASRPAYDSLASYDTMMMYFWIWDTSKFIDWSEPGWKVEQEQNRRRAEAGKEILNNTQYRVP